jgi:uncharacterized repeat protein (TIGR01451 family)
MRGNVVTAALVMTLGLAGPAGGAPAQGSLQLKTIAEKEIRVLKPNGEAEVRRVPAGKVIPGDEVIYTIEAKNLTDTPVENVVITDPVPEHTAYVAGTANGSETTVTFSIDGGQRYDVPENLVVTQPDGTQRSALPSEYTHIRWEFTRAIDPGKTRLVRFRAKLQ